MHLFPEQFRSDCRWNLTTKTKISKNFSANDIYQVRNQKFHWMRVLVSYGNSLCVLMVDFVDVRVNLRMMEESVSPVEEKVLNYHAERELEDNVFARTPNASNCDSEHQMLTMLEDYQGLSSLKFH